MKLRIDHAQPSDAPIIAQMVGELLREIMAVAGTSVLLARDVDRGEPLGFLALYESYALYTEGAYGTISEFYIRPAHRSKGVGAALLKEARRLGQSRGWRRLEVTTPPLPQFDRALAFYQREGFSISGGRKQKLKWS